VIACGRVRRQLSAYMDGDLEAGPARRVAVHLDGCPACAARWRSLRSAVDMLAEAPRLECRDLISTRVADRLEVETRSAGLALILRPTWKARPLIFPSLIPAAAVLVVVLGLAFILDRAPEPLPAVVTRGAESWGPTAASGTESNPLFLSAEVSAPRVRTAAPINDLLAALGEEPLFVETVVARDGSVSTVTLLGGNSLQAGPLLEALRHERFEPGRRHGRPVAVSLYRLISRTDVHAPVT
jgi:anti-sigma factor RsiW